MSTPLGRMPVVSAACVTVVGLAGCSKSFTARECPSFYDPSLSPLSAADHTQDAETLRQLGGVQAFVAGALLRNSAISGLYPYRPATLRTVGGAAGSDMNSSRKTEEIAERAGLGSYTLSFHAMGESVMHHDFTIK